MYRRLRAHTKYKHASLAARARLGRSRDLPPERLRAPGVASAVGVVPGRRGLKVARALCRPLRAPEASQHH